MIKSLTNLSSQASIHEEPQGFDLYYGNRKKLASFQSYVIFIKNKYNSVTNHEGFINFGTSINTIIPQTTIKYFPQFMKLEDCYYPDPRGYDEFNKKVCEGTKFQWNETFTLNNIHTILSILCYKYKNIFVIGKTEKINMKIILDHSQSRIVDTEQNANLVIFFDHSKQKVQSIEQKNPKTVKLFLLSNKDQLNLFDANKSNQAFVYQYAFKQGINLAALHTKELDIKKCIHEEWFFCATSSITRRASLSPDLKIEMEETGTGTIRKMIQIDSQSIVPEKNIWLTTGVSAGIDNLSRILFKNVTLGVDAPYYFGFNSYFTHHNAKIVSKPILPGSRMVDRIAQSERQGCAGYIICNPKNPDGTVLEHEEVDQICEYVRNKPNFHLVFDEAFWNTCFGKETKSAASYAVQLPNVHVVRGMAKDFGLGGVKIGYTISSNPLVMQKFEEWKPIISHHPYSVSVINYMLKKSNYGAEIFEVGKKLLRDYFEIVYSQLDKENISYLKPDAGCFVYVNLKEFLRQNTYDQQCLLWKKLFYKYRVNISNGANFTTPQYGYFRLCPILEESEMREGLRRMISAIKDQQKQFGDLQI